MCPILDLTCQVSTQAKKTAATLCSILPNADIIPHVGSLVSSMASPTNVPSTIKALSNTTFVAEVNAPTLAIMVPLLTRALKERSTETTRMTCIVIGNLVKLVRDPDVAARYLSSLVAGVENIASSAAFPEIRAFAQTALDILKQSGASSDAKIPPPRDIAGSTKECLKLIFPHLPIPFAFPDNPSLPLRMDMPNAPILADAMEYVGGMVADLVDSRLWDEKTWTGRVLGSPLSHWLEGGKTQGQSVAQEIRGVFMDIDKAKYAPAVEEDDGEGEMLCDIQFSLAYGGLLLLNHTTLRLRRGRRYGICAGNGKGKSTLMKAIRDGKVEGFPPQDQLRTLMVEHALQGEDATLPIIDFIATDKNLIAKGTKRESIRDALLQVGFSDEKQGNSVGSLSGGWKMKLELARAMLIGADILLLDEPTNHLGEFRAMSVLRNIITDVKFLSSYLARCPSSSCPLRSMLAKPWKASHDRVRPGIAIGCGVRTIISI